VHTVYVETLMEKRFFSPLCVCVCVCVCGGVWVCVCVCVCVCVGVCLGVENPAANRYRGWDLNPGSKPQSDIHWSSFYGQMPSGAHICTSINLIKFKSLSLEAFLLSYFTKR
jgi:hypothetical protein